MGTVTYYCAYKLSKKIITFIIYQTKGDYYMNKVYKSIGNFIMRTPLLPISVYKQIFCSDTSDDELEKKAQDIRIINKISN